MPLNRITPNNATNDTLANLTSVNGEEIKKISKCVDTSTNLLKVDIEDAQINVDGTGLATEQTLQDLDTRIGNSIFTSATALGTGQALIQTTTRALNSGSNTMKPLLMDASDNLNVNINAGAGSHGLATENKQDVMETSLNSIDTRIGNSVNAGSTVYGDAASGVISTYAYGRDSGNNQMKALSLDTSGNLNVNMASGAITGFATEATQLLAEAHLGTIDASTASVAGCVSGSELQVDIVGAPTITVSGAVTANAGTNLNTSTLATQTTLADAEAHLGTIDASTASLAGCVSGSELQVDIVSGAGDASASNQTSMINKLTEIDNAQDLTNTKLDTIDGVLDSILVDTSLVASQQLLQTSHLALHQTATTNTTITIGNGLSSDTKEVSLSDIRSAILEPSVIGYHITSTGTGGSGSDVQMMISLDGSTFITLDTNISASSKPSFTGNLGDDNLGLALIGQKFKFRITNNSGGSANYTVSIFAYGVDFAQA